ncbi:MAG TPA: glycogen synthase GlgA [Epulopiscium sp.]|nr:glycogen synthase GlgA [Candidatus Epulonipiscium sp.]
MKKLKVLFVASEVVPFAKTGGLADVLGSLPQELRGQDIDARVVMPYYQCITSIEKKAKWMDSYVISLGWRNQEANIFLLDEDVPTYFIRNYEYFNRGELYGYEDDDERFAFFCKAVLEMLPRVDFIPDIIHCNDWQTGPICLFLKDTYRHNPMYNSIKTVFTIHNIQYQGIFGREALEMLEISDGYFHPEAIEHYGAISYMKAGIGYADLITTVSPSYGEEIQTPEYGYGLDGLLRKRSNAVHGIINGIDEVKYNPSTDPHLYANYSVKDLKGKKENKKQFQKEYGLVQEDKMVIAIITRLAIQKGLDLFHHTIDGVWIMDKMMEMDVQFVLLGTGEPEYENMFKHLAYKYPGRVSINITFNEKLSHRIYAASDVFLMPSMFEPCGLGQLMAMKYGSVPVVRKTGGLKDTVIHYNETEKTGTGFEFEDYSGYWLYNKINEAYRYYNEKPEEFEQIRANGMNSDFGWDKSASKYIALYNTLKG